MKQDRKKNKRWIDRDYKKKTREREKRKNKIGHGRSNILV